MRVSVATRESFSARLRVSDGDSPAVTNVGKRNTYVSLSTCRENLLSMAFYQWWRTFHVSRDLHAMEKMVGTYIHTYIPT